MKQGLLLMALLITIIVMFGVENAIHESQHQQRFSLNVWVGVLGDRLIGPHILLNKLTGKRYRLFMRNILPVLLEDVPLQQSQNMWFMHDGAPAHFARAVRRHLT
jgi:hypothetical protein